MVTELKDGLKANTLIMNELIPKNLEPSQLYKLGTDLANEVATLGKTVAGYEVEVTSKSKTYKLELAKAKILNMDKKYTATIINALAEVSTEVVTAGNYLMQAEANLLIGKAELEGRDKQLMMVKKIMDLKVQELRTFRG